MNDKQTLKNFTPQNDLEQLIMDGNNPAIIGEIICNNLKLSRWDILAEPYFTNLDLNAAYAIALLAVPADKHSDVLELVETKCGRDSIAYDFLSIEYQTSGNCISPSPKEQQLITAVMNGDNDNILRLANNNSDWFDTTLPDGFVKALIALEDSVRQEVIQCMYPRAKTILLRDLLMVDDNSALATAEIMSLPYSDRIKLIDALMHSMMR